MNRLKRQTGGLVRTTCTCWILVASTKVSMGEKKIVPYWVIGIRSCVACYWTRGQLYQRFWAPLLYECDRTAISSECDTTVLLRSGIFESSRHVPRCRPSKSL
jgi:hypothetical protein